MAVMTAPYDDKSAWSSLHEMALIYLALLNSSDNDLRSDSVPVTRDLLRSWFPDIDDQRLDQVIQDVLLIQLSTLSDRMLSAAVESLRQSMPRDQRIAVLSELADVAMADGFVIPDEASFIERLAQEWDIERDVQ
jgi:uncharacterized tellurite resistance protein B-like protein